jgi:methyl-accepting chemotaxis protein
MTAIEETIAAVQALIQQLQQSAATAGTAARSAQQGQARAAQLGTQVSIHRFAQLHSGLNGVQSQIGALTDRVKQLLTLSKAIHGG